MHRKYPDEFRAPAVKQVAERGYAPKEVSEQLEVSTRSLYQWLRGPGGRLTDVRTVS